MRVGPARRGGATPRWCARADPGAPPGVRPARLAPPVNQLSVIAHAASSTQSAGSRGTSSASDSASSSEETRAFLQRRVAAVGRVLSGIFGTFLTYRLIATLFEPNVYGPDV